MSENKNNLIIGNVLNHINQCDSTNSYVKDFITKSKPLEGTVFYTDKQTAGRGQFGNSWQSEEGQNLTFSFIVYPKFLGVDMQFYLSKVVCIAIVDALNSLTNMPFKIKWPNDIYYKNKKLAGILIENQLSNNQISNAIIGIGINVNQENFEGLSNATSLFNIVKYLFNKKKVLEVVLKNLDVQYLKLIAKKNDEIDTDYHHKLISYKNNFFFIENGEQKNGILQKVNSAGQLEVLVNNELKKYNFKEIEWVLQK